MSACECGSCGQHFAGVTAFDAHLKRTYGIRPPLTCLPPASLGMVRNRFGRWRLPDKPGRKPPWLMRGES